MPSDGLFTGAADRSRWRAARATRRRQEPLRTKTKLAPARGINRLANAGPTMPEILTCKPLKVAADGSSESETTWGTIGGFHGVTKTVRLPSFRNFATLIGLQP